MFTDDPPGWTWEWTTKSEKDNWNCTSSNKFGDVKKAGNCTIILNNSAAGFKQLMGNGQFSGAVLCVPCAELNGVSYSVDIETIGTLTNPAVMFINNFPDIDQWAWHKADSSTVGWVCSSSHSHSINGCKKTLKTGEPVFLHYHEGDNKSSTTQADGGSVLCLKCALAAGLPMPEFEFTLEPAVLVSNDEYIIPGSECPDYHWKWRVLPEYQYVRKCNGYSENKGCGRTIQTGENTLELTKIGSGKFVGYRFCEECAANLGITKDGDMAGKPKICLGCNILLCNVCDVCHTDGCNFIGYKVITESSKAKYAHLKAKTQKARGYITLEAAKLRVPKPYNIICGDDDIAGAVALLKTRSYKSFVRPCPTRPRHGFVDSREIESHDNSTAELQALLSDARSKDEMGHAELLIVPYIKSAYNAIVTPSRIAIGPGHDGATAGHGSDIIPLVGMPFPEISDDILRRAGIKSDEDPYIESVLTDDSEVYFTQIRAGVKIPPTVGKDYVPFPIRVENVIEASGDLIEWEAQTKTITRGTVVCHVGGTLISHYGVHCINNDVPVFTSRKPAIGEALEVCSRAPKPDPDAVIRGVIAGIGVPMNVMTADVMVGADVSVRRALIGMMVALHNYAAMGGEDGYNLGLAVAVMYRCGMAASHGEARHKITGYTNGRTTVYKLAFKDFFDARSTLGQAQYKFKKLSWSSGYGGKAWANCTDSIIQMDESIRKLIREPNETHVKELVDKLNVAVNQAHNGGWWLNKFIGKDWFDRASKQSLEAVVSGAVALYHMKNLAKDIDAAEILKKLSESEDIKVENGKLFIEASAAEIAVKKPKKKSTKAKKDIPIVGPKLANDDVITQAGYMIPPKTENYVGVLCGTCGAEYSLDKEAANGCKCGKGWETGIGCPGPCGWYEDGNFYFINKLDSESPADPEHSDDDESDSDKCSDPDCKQCHPEPKSVGKSTNVGGIIPTTKDSVVEAAQFNIHKAGAFLHVQIKTADSEGYYSFNVSSITSPLVASKYNASNISWSGSGVDNYIKLTPTHVQNEMWRLSAEDMSILVDIVSMVGIISKPEEEVKNEPTQQIEEAPF